jgi:hypothetical protein
VASVIFPGEEGRNARKTGSEEGGKEEGKKARKETEGMKKKERTRHGRK